MVIISLIREFSGTSVSFHLHWIGTTSQTFLYCNKGYFLVYGLTVIKLTGGISRDSVNLMQDPVSCSEHVQMDSKPTIKTILK